MDQQQLQNLIPPKQQNPLLKRKPLNLGNKFYVYKNTEQPLEEWQTPLARDHLILLLFGAEWCNITKNFIKKLADSYQEMNLESKKIEIIYVGFEKSKKEFDSFTKQMPWAGLSFSDERTQGLKEFYNIRAIPSLILLDGKGEMVCECKKDVSIMEPDDALEKWKKLRSEQEEKYMVGKQ